MTVYFGFAVADSMFDGDVTIKRREITPAEARQFVERGAISCVNPSHAATIEALAERFGIVVDVPETAPIVRLHAGDILILASVRGLPRLENRHEYTAQEIDAAEFKFASWRVL